MNEQYVHKVCVRTAYLAVCMNLFGQSKFDPDGTIADRETIDVFQIVT